LQVLLDCIAQEYAALREAASLKLCTAVESADAQTGGGSSSSSSDKQNFSTVEPAGCNIAEDQA
jgi:hypothetical protein